MSSTLGTTGRTDAQASDPWERMSIDIAVHDDTITSDWNGEMDTMLVFAALFSAIVGAFVVEFYKKLLPGGGDDGPSSTTNSSLGAVASPNVFIVAGNTLCFASLMCALVCACVGTLVKQWIRQHAKPNYLSWKDKSRIRESKLQALDSWGVPVIIGVLPVLLRTAMSSFFIGLALIFQTINSLIATTISAIAGVWFAFYIATTLLPAVCHGSPYRSPEAFIFLSIPHVIMWLFRTSYRDDIRHLSWMDHASVIPAHQYNLPFHDLDPHVVATADRLFGDEYLEKYLVECVRRFPPASILRCVSMICSQRVTGRRGLGFLWGPSLLKSKEFRSKDMSRITPAARLALIKMLLYAITEPDTTFTSSNPIATGDEFQDTVMQPHQYAAQGIGDLLQVDQHGNEQIMDFLMHWIIEHPNSDLVETLPAMFISACSSDITFCVKWGNTTQMTIPWLVKRVAHTVDGTTDIYGEDGAPVYPNPIVACSIILPSISAASPEILLPLLRRDYRTNVPENKGAVDLAELRNPGTPRHRSFGAYSSRAAQSIRDALRGSRKRMRSAQSVVESSNGEVDDSAVQSADESEEEHDKSAASPASTYSPPPLRANIAAYSSSPSFLESVIQSYAIALRQSTLPTIADTALLHDKVYRDQLLVLTNRSLDCLGQVTPKVIGLRRVAMNEELKELREVLGVTLTLEHCQVLNVIQRWRLRNAFIALRTGLEHCKEQIERL